MSENKKGFSFSAKPLWVEEAMPESNEIIKDLAKIQHVKFL
jgi:hypothetical protein